jgi:hypothetical protein
MASQRDATAGVLSALAASVKTWAILYEGIFSVAGVDTPLNLWTGRGDLLWNAITWKGAGQLLAVDLGEEISEVRSIGFSLSLSGMAPGIVDLAENSIRSGKPGRLWLALFDSAGAIIPDPYPLKRGRFDTDSIKHSGGTCTVTVQYESILATLDRPRERRWTNADQQLDYPADKGFEYVTKLQDATLTWG